MKVKVIRQVVDRTASGRVFSAMEGRVLDVDDADTELVDLLRGYEQRGDVVIDRTEAKVEAKADEQADAERAAAAQRADAAGIPGPAEPDTAEPSTKAVKAAPAKKAAG